MLVQGSWPTLDWLRYQIKGGPRLPIRNPAGITPAGMSEIADVTRAFLAVKLGIH
jgi:hypothetical protein